MRNYRRKNLEKIREFEKTRRNNPKERQSRRDYAKEHCKKPSVRARTRKAVRELYRGRKRELVKFMGGKCSHCGLKPEDIDGCFAVFAVDEIKPLGIGKKKFTNLSKKDLDFAKKLFLEGKTQLLCQNCSAIKTWKNNESRNRRTLTNIPEGLLHSSGDDN